jgi:16S rRNA (guanine966-N2)-methyltransferase
VSRIIAGSRGGRRVAMPPGDKTRPTTDRVREALFSAIAAWAGSADASAEESLGGLAFCDLYAGSGAVGLEAASRGAEPVLLVEGNKRTAQVAERNVSELRLSARVRAARVEQLAAQQAPLAFDVVFLDPPYDVTSRAVGEVLGALAEHGWLRPDALVVVERSRRSDDFVWPARVGEAWTRGYGETVLHFGSCSPAPSTADTLPEQRP